MKLKKLCMHNALYITHTKQWNQLCRVLLTNSPSAPLPVLTSTVLHKISNRKQLHVQWLQSYSLPSQVHKQTHTTNNNTRNIRIKVHLAPLVTIPVWWCDLSWSACWQMPLPSLNKVVCSIEPWISITLPGNHVSRSIVSSINCLTNLDVPFSCVTFLSSFLLFLVSADFLARSRCSVSKCNHTFQPNINSDRETSLLHCGVIQYVRRYRLLTSLFPPVTFGSPSPPYHY